MSIYYKKLENGDSMNQEKRIILEREYLKNLMICPVKRIKDNIMNMENLRWI